jgi:hypothetical protein
MVTTRRTKMTTNTLDHVIITLMEIPIKSHTYTVLKEQGITSAFDISSLNDDVIPDLVADLHDEDGNLVDTNVPMSKFHQISLRHMSNFLKYLKKENNDILNEETILKATKSEWDQFRIDAPILSTNATATNDVKDFLKGNKRDKSQYEVLKDERQFDNWQGSFIALARTHKIADVLNPAYVPSNTNDRLLFAEKQEFAYTVLDATLRTNMGKTLVRKYRHNSNA